MNERPTRPAFKVVVYAPHLGRSIEVWMAVPDGVLPMDLYNALYKRYKDMESQHGWLTNLGRLVSPEEAAELALEAGMLERKVSRLSYTEFQGSWRKTRTTTPTTR
jgi:hypothetical protein